MIIAYATSKDGNGYVEKIGEYESPDEIEIRVGLFADDVVISFEEEDEKIKD
jgi:hypothetical protein